MNFSTKMQVELFHLLFLRLFNSQIAANLYAIKGGCNLRFFFDSIRYSEDLDLDIQTIQKHTLENKINKILASPTLIKLLQGYGISKIDFTAPKQTPITQRWKIQLSTEQSEIPLYTKIEFSRRQDKFKSQLDTLSMSICQQYRLPPTRLSHYGLQEAITQKILALAHRSLTQARDVFDLHHLLHLEKPPKIALPASILNKAYEAATSIHFEDYKSQVINFLEPKQQAALDNKTYWKNLSNQVTDYLQDEST